MGDLPVVLMVLVGLLLMSLAAGLYLFRKGMTQKPDYRAWFWIGVIWAPFGLIMALWLDNAGYWGFTAMGLVFLVLGWRRRDQWSEAKRFADLTPQERRFKLVAVGIGVLLLAVGVITFLLIRSGLI